MRMYMKIGEILLCMRYITDEQLQHGLKLQQLNPNKFLGMIFIEQQYITDEQLIGALKEQAQLLNYGIKGLQ